MLFFRRYLLIRNKAARQALTRMLLSDHRLAVETGRWEGVERCQRLCRLCEAAVEDPEHVLFVCTANAPLLLHRASFWDELQTACTASAPIRKVPALCHTTDAHSACLRLKLMRYPERIFALLADLKTAGILAVFTHRVFLMFDALPRRRYPQQDGQQDGAV